MMKVTPKVVDVSEYLADSVKDRSYEIRDYALHCWQSNDGQNLGEQCNGISAPVISSCFFSSPITISRGTLNLSLSAIVLHL